MTVKTKKILIAFSVYLLLVFTLNLVSAVLVEDVSVGQLSPGKDADMTVTLKNNLDEKIEDVSFSLSFTDPVTHANLPITSVGSSDYNVDEIDDDDTEEFKFRIRASSSAEPGDYSISYKISYKDISNAQEGTIGVTVQGTVDLEYSAKEENPVIGESGKINLKIINKGFADAKFVSIKINPDGYTLISEDEVYVGTISSDDFETIEMDVIFGDDPALNAAVTYKDFNNNDITKKIELPIKVYTKERAIELGILKQSYTAVYILSLAVLILFIIVIRLFNKRNRMAKSRARAEAEKIKEAMR